MVRLFLHFISFLLLQHWTWDNNNYDCIIVLLLSAVAEQWEATTIQSTTISWIHRSWSTRLFRSTPKTATATATTISIALTSVCFIITSLPLSSFHFINSFLIKSNQRFSILIGSCWRFNPKLITRDDWLFTSALSTWQQIDLCSKSISWFDTVGSCQDHPTLNAIQFYCA